MLVNVVVKRRENLLKKKEEKFCQKFSKIFAKKKRRVVSVVSFGRQFFEHPPPN